MSLFLSKLGKLCLTGLSLKRSTPIQGDFSGNGDWNSIDFNVGG